MKNVLQDMPICNDDSRRDALLEQDQVLGVDHVQVEADGHTLRVHFLFDRTKLEDRLLALVEENLVVKIEGGVRVRDIRIAGYEPDGETLKVKIDRLGDVSPYKLSLKADDAIDPVYRSAEFSFSVDCPSKFDCGPRSEQSFEEPSELPIDYLAKDYASFRRALIDLIPTLAPQWTERLEADLGITLIEMLAYVGDSLSYYQDAVANEAWLETARQRISVRRHARLIDYQMHDGASATTVVQVRVKAKTLLPHGTALISRIVEPLGSQQPPIPTVIHGLRDAALDAALDAAEVVFESLGNTTLRRELNEISFYTWGNKSCCLPAGATSACLDAKLENVIYEKVGNNTRLWKEFNGLIMFKEIASPETGQQADADPQRRQLVRVIEAKEIEDPLTNKTLTQIRWHQDDALRFPMCLAVELDGRPIITSRAFGNLVVADHGRTVEAETHHLPLKPRNENQSRVHRVLLEKGPLSFGLSVGNLEREIGDNRASLGATDLLRADPPSALPRVEVTIDKGVDREWSPERDLLRSDPFDPHFAVETDNLGRALLRFGDGTFGKLPPHRDSADEEPGITVRYRIGTGAAGNIGRDSIKHIVSNSNDDGLRGNVQDNGVTNPLPAEGGVDPEGIEQVKAVAPAAFHANPRRAVTEEDYVRLAEEHADVAKAVAAFRWTGSWYSVLVTVDPVGQPELDRDSRRNIREHIEQFSLVGYEVSVNGLELVPLAIKLVVSVSDGHFRGDVEKDLLARLSCQKLPDGSLGFFHPDNFTFGQPLYLSQLIQSVEASRGVQSVRIDRFARQSDPAGATELNKRRGFIEVERLEIIRLDNDARAPENGTLELVMEGGK